MTPCLVSGDTPSRPIHHHFRRTGEEAVRVRVVGRPQDLVRPDIVGEHLEAPLNEAGSDQLRRFAFCSKVG
jgi:hypothetical protein